MVRGPNKKRVAGIRCGFADVRDMFEARLVFDTGKHFDGTAAPLTGFTIDLEHAASHKLGTKVSVS